MREYIPAKRVGSPDSKYAYNLDQFDEDIAASRKRIADKKAAVKDYLMAQFDQSLQHDTIYHDVIIEAVREIKRDMGF